MSRHTRGSPSMWPGAWGRWRLTSRRRWSATALVSSSIRWTVAGAIDFGGGLDFRLTRLMSLRAEARDFVVSGKHLGGQDGYNHPIFGFGVGFHF